ncbi:cell lysis protein [Enterobacteria phage FL76 Tallahassee/FL/2012]|uniref:GPE n=3 Tax=Gequatrovirus talmos TaxID=1910969 RepID=Q2LMC7_9VIRU|nr:gpE [Escherichia phage ID2 Moscow/ID/2001]AAZ48953.1 gpE [Escherichia phage ID2 Moscow/ID/2001]AGS81869.1 cell lysis protein [Enterobacteria phage FL68 Tallahassee/FL/2012]AGS81880.1 cell lysis protein [Enterobacteria phage FL76 Tallahassee/FL/2012]
MVHWTLSDTLAFLLLLSLLLPSLLIMFIPLTSRQHVLLWKAPSSPKILSMVLTSQLRPLNYSLLPCVYAPETLTMLHMQKLTYVNNYVLKE